MEPKPLDLSSSYRNYVRGIRELHRLTVLGKDESPEADQIRDTMDAPWKAMTAIERTRAGGLSEDLFSLSDPTVDRCHDLESQAQEILAETHAAQSGGDWDRAFDLLRASASTLPPDVLSLERGTTWLKAGDPESALLFLEHSARLNPSNAKYLDGLSHTLGGGVGIYELARPSY